MFKMKAMGRLPENSITNLQSLLTGQPLEGERMGHQSLSHFFPQLHNDWDLGHPSSQPCPSSHQVLDKEADASIPNVCAGEPVHIFPHFSVPFFLPPSIFSADPRPRGCWALHAGWPLLITVPSATEAVISSVLLVNILPSAFRNLFQKFVKIISLTPPSCFLGGCRLYPVLFL